MKEIPLTQNKAAMVDDDDFEFLNQWKWYALKAHRGIWYATRNGNSKTERRQFFYMHRVIMRVKSGQLVDHKDDNGLNNQRLNLRKATSSKNIGNQRKWNKATSSRFKGVCFDRKNKRWSASIMVNRKHVWLGRFLVEKDAALAYNNAAVRHFGEFARLNEV